MVCITVTFAWTVPRTAPNRLSGDSYIIPERGVTQRWLRDHGMLLRPFSLLLAVLLIRITPTLAVTHSSAIFRILLSQMKICPDEVSVGHISCKFRLNNVFKATEVASTFSVGMFEPSTQILAPYRHLATASRLMNNSSKVHNTS